MLGHYFRFCPPLLTVFPHLAPEAQIAKKRRSIGPSRLHKFAPPIVNCVLSERPSASAYSPPAPRAGPPRAMSCRAAGCTSRHREQRSDRLRKSEADSSTPGLAERSCPVPTVSGPVPQITADSAAAAPLYVCDSRRNQGLVSAWQAAIPYPQLPWLPERCRAQPEPRSSSASLRCGAAPVASPPSRPPRSPKRRQ